MSGESLPSAGTERACPDPVLDALADDDRRAMLAAGPEASVTVAEVVARCGIPVSTVDRSRGRQLLAEGATGALYTDGGNPPSESDTKDRTQQRLYSIFVSITGTNVLVEEQHEESSPWFDEAVDDPGDAESLEEYVTATARADGLSEAIDGPDSGY